MNGRRVVTGSYVTSGVGRKVLGSTGDQVSGGNSGTTAKGAPSVPFPPLNELRDPSLKTGSRQRPHENSGRHVGPVPLGEQTQQHIGVRLQRRPLVAAHRLGRDAARPPPALRPFDRRRGAYPEPAGRPPRRHLALNRRNHAFPQILRICSWHGSPHHIIYTVRLAQHKKYRSSRSRKSLFNLNGERPRTARDSRHIVRQLPPWQQCSRDRCLLVWRNRR